MLKKILTVISAFALIFPGCSTESEENFPKKVEVLYTGNVSGFLAPCDCPDEHLNGSLAEIKKLIDDRRKDTTLVLESGNFFAPFPDNLRNKYVVKFLKEIKYDALFPGENELKFGTNFFRKQISENEIPVVEGNLQLSKEDMDVTSRYVIEDLEGVKIAITGICGKNIYNNFKEFVNYTDPPEKFLKELVPELKEKADLIVVLSQQSLQEDKELAGNIEGINLIINGYLKDKIEEKVNNTLILGSGNKGKFLGKVILNITEKHKVDQYTNKLLSLEEISPELDESSKELLKKYNKKRKEQMGNRMK
ncbi:MAG: hypothetical protein ACQEQC_01100 [Elusimicrobiota bacterium]